MATEVPGIRFVTTLDEAQRVVADLQERLRLAEVNSQNGWSRAKEQTELAEKRWFDMRDRYVCAALNVPAVASKPTVEGVADAAFDLANALLRRRGRGIPPYESAT